MNEFVAFCLRCGVKLTYTPKTRAKKYCSAYCRWKHWASLNRAKLNESVRVYRRKRYIKEGRWRENGPSVVALREWMQELKSKPCCDCGKNFPMCCMDFDHRIDEKKMYNIGSMFAHHYSRKLIESELAKCELVCSNCHRIRTQKRKLGSGVMYVQ